MQKNTCVTSTKKKMKASVFKCQLNKTTRAGDTIALKFKSMEFQVMIARKMTSKMRLRN